MWLAEGPRGQSHRAVGAAARGGRKQLITALESVTDSPPIGLALAMAKRSPAPGRRPRCSRDPIPTRGGTVFGQKRDQRSRLQWLQGTIGQIEIRCPAKNTHTKQILLLLAKRLAQLSLGQSRLRSERGDDFLEARIAAPPACSSTVSR